MTEPPRQPRTRRKLDHWFFGLLGLILISLGIDVLSDSKSLDCLFTVLAVGVWEMPMLGED